MEAVCSSEMSPHLTTTRCRNPKEDHYLISNHYDNSKTYSFINTYSCHQNRNLFNSKQLWFQVTTVNGLNMQLKKHTAYEITWLQGIQSFCDQKFSKRLILTYFSHLLVVEEFIYT
jgi:hypothetical protein